MIREEGRGIRNKRKEEVRKDEERRNESGRGRKQDRKGGRKARQEEFKMKYIVGVCKLLHYHI